MGDKGNSHVFDTSAKYIVKHITIYNRVIHLCRYCNRFVYKKNQDIQTKTR